MEARASRAPSPKGWAERRAFLRWITCVEAMVYMAWVIWRTWRTFRIRLRICRVFFAIS